MVANVVTRPLMKKILATKWKRDEKFCSDKLASVVNTSDSVVEIDSSSTLRPDGNWLNLQSVTLKFGTLTSK